MRLNKKEILFITFLIGVVTPFIPYLTIIEMFFLLIPFAVIFTVTSIHLLLSFLIKNLSSGKAAFTFSILPIFILSQLASVFTVDKIQKIRSEGIIREIKKIKTETGNFPEQYDLLMGIEYQRRDGNNFELSYSSGFMVTEKYDSESNRWESYGWND